MTMTRRYENARISALDKQQIPRYPVSSPHFDVLLGGRLGNYI